jgi:hypothetical protein
MRNRVLGLTPVAALTSAVLLFGSAHAAPTGLADGARAGLDRLNILETVHMRRGQNYCWYEDGWNGSGWYVCGYAGRKGYGWGGPYGWNGWASPMWGHRYGSMGHMGPAYGYMGHHMMGGHMMGGCCW